MGGDDLGSEDEYLNPVVGEESDDDGFVDADAATTNDSSPIQGSSKRNNKKTKKRKLIQVQEDSSESDVLRQTSKKPTTNRAHFLVNAGRDLMNQPIEVQHQFLKTSLEHYNKLQQGSNETDKQNLIDQLSLSHFSDATTEASTNNITPDFATQFKAIVPSTKRLKKWKHVGSPMVLIVTVSARRAVAILKDLASFKVRAAKLFAKHMSIQQQQTMLRDGSFGLAVGTPHRLQALCSGQVPALNLEHTQLVVLDAHTNSKGYTVSTLPDTAPACMSFVRDSVLPQLVKRKDTKIAMI